MHFHSQIEPKNFNKAEFDEFWILAMQEKLNQFERNQVWDLVAKPIEPTMLDTK